MLLLQFPRVFSFFLGLCFGNLQSGYLLGRLKGIDIRNYGSHSTGATNSLRVMGTGAGALVLLLDALKAFFPCMLAQLLVGGSRSDGFSALYMLWAALGGTLGHDYPLLLHGRGGKGVACTVGILFAFSWKTALLWMAFFLLIAIATRYVSLSSILSMLFIIGCTLFFFCTERLLLPTGREVEGLAIAFLIPLLSIWRHRSNMLRLVRGEESKVKLFTKGMKVSK